MLPYHNVEALEAALRMLWQGWLGARSFDLEYEGKAFGPQELIIRHCEGDSCDGWDILRGTGEP